MEYFLNIYLNKNITQNNLFDSLDTYGITSETESIMITGETNSRVNELFTYGGELKIGVNGLLEKNDYIVKYELDGIIYETDLSTDKTIYTIYKNVDNFNNLHLVPNENMPFSNIKKTIDAMLIERNNISVFDYMNRLATCKSPTDTENIFN